MKRVAQALKRDAKKGRTTVQDTRVLGLCKHHKLDFYETTMYLLNKGHLRRMSKNRKGYPYRMVK